MTYGANCNRRKLHHSPWHSDIRTYHQLNILGVQTRTHNRQPVGFPRLGPMSGYAVWVFLIMVTCRYSTFDHKILMMLRHCCFGCTGRLSNQKMERHAPCPVLEMSYIGKQTISGVECCII